MANIEAITKDYEKISDRREVPSEAAYQKRLLEIQKKAEDYQNEVLRRQDKLADACLKALQKIEDAIEEVVSQIIREQKLQVVLARSGIVAAAKTAMAGASISRVTPRKAKYISKARASRIDSTPAMVSP